MWLDSRGVTHTVALSDPSKAMSRETTASLNSLSDEESAQVMRALDDYCWNDYVARSRSDIIASVLAPEGASLPHGFVKGVIGSADDALRVESDRAGLGGGRS